MKQQTGVDPDQVADFTVGAQLPGGKSVTRPAAPGQRVELAVDSRRYNTGTIAWLVAAAAAAAAAALAVVALLLLLKRLMYRKDRRR